MATGQAARKSRAKSKKLVWVPYGRNAVDPNVPGGECVDEAKGPQRAGFSADAKPPLVGDMLHGCVAEKRIYPGDKEEVAYTFDGFVAFAGSEKIGLQMWNERPSTAPEMVSLAPAGSADQRGKVSNGKGNS